MALGVSVTSSTYQGHLDVQWPTSYYISRGAGTFVAVCIVDVDGDNSWHDRSKNREWVAVIYDGATTTVRLDATSLERSRVSVIVHDCSRVTGRDGSTAYRVDQQRQSPACRWTAPRSTSTVATSHFAGVDYWRRFVSRILGRLVPEVVTSFFTYLFGRQSTGRPVRHVPQLPLLSLSSREQVWELSVNLQLNQRMSSRMASVQWNYSGSLSPDKWMVTVINLTWTVDDLKHHHWVFFISDSQRTKFQMPLLLQNGNRYKVIVRGLKQQRQDVSTTAECFSVLCRGTGEIRAGDVLTISEVFYLKNAATEYLRRKSRNYTPCKWFYRNKSSIYFAKVAADGGVMKTLLKDASGDELSPINGEISGLFFLANVDYSGEPFDASPFGYTATGSR